MKYHMAGVALSPDIELGYPYYQNAREAAADRRALRAIAEAAGKSDFWKVHEIVEKEFAETGFQVRIDMAFGFKPDKKGMQKLQETASWEVFLHARLGVIFERNAAFDRLLEQLSERHERKAEILELYSRGSWHMASERMIENGVGMQMLDLWLKDREERVAPLFGKVYGVHMQNCRERESYVLSVNAVQRLLRNMEQRQEKNSIRMNKIKK